MHIKNEPRHIMAKWAIERTEDHNAIFSNDVWEEIGKSLQQDIDMEIVNDIKRHDLMLKGWQKAPFTSDKFATPGNHQIADVAAWIHMNTTKQYLIFGREFWFASKEDLTLFVLRWA